VTDGAKTRSRKRIIVWSVIGLLVVFALVRAFRPAPVLVDFAEVGRGTLRVTVDDDGRTRVRERFTISAPIQGRLLRTPLKAGDPVRAADTIVAEFQPAAPDPLDVRTRREAEARLSRAEAALAEAQARRSQAAAEHEFAETDLARVTKLVGQGVAPREELDRAHRDEATGEEAERAAERAVDVARYAVEEARASLFETSTAEPATEPTRRPLEKSESVPNGKTAHPYVESDQGRLLLRAPIDGEVLRVFEESARTLAAGTPILEVGDTRNLEIVADYLSEDAVKVKPGMMVMVAGWGGEQLGGNENLLKASVRLVEPAGFTKISALGVEEQRVNIIMDPAGDADAWAALGDGYRVELQIVLWEGHDVVIVPTGALFREGSGWSAFVMKNRRAERRSVEISHMGGLEAEVTAGLEPGDRVVMYPSELIADGTRVEPR
jgi:HlyD family secretion protein